MAKTQSDFHINPEITFKTSNIGVVKDEKLKSLILEWIKAENLVNSISSLSPLTLFRSLVVAVLSMMLAGAVLMEYKTLKSTVKPRLQLNSSSSSHQLFSPPERIYDSNGYLMVYCNGGLNQMRSGISDMVAIARYLNVTLIIPELDNTSFWKDPSHFEDIFDADYFIESLKDEVRILKQLPPKLKKRVENKYLYSMIPDMWSDMSYYHNKVLPRIRKYNVVHFLKTDARIANNGISKDVQRLRCRANYEALRFTPQIEEVGKKIVRILRQKGLFLALHLRYEMDMIAFSACYGGLNETEVEELTELRHSHPVWGMKQIDYHITRQVGLCPLTPEETALTLRALDIDPKMQIYMAAGDIYGGEKRMGPLRKAFPNLVTKEILLEPSDLEPFQNHSNRMAALDYIVAIESDIFMATHSGNMDKVVEGHRRYLGFKTTINLDRYRLVRLIDQYKNGTLSWDKFSNAVKVVHANRIGGPTTRKKYPTRPKFEDYFYTNPEECLPQIVKKSKSGST